MKKLLFLFLFFAISLFLPFSVHASSQYVLPYPSVMPGGINYKLHLAWEKIMQYWYFGDFGQFEYNLKESDKYLVEAKTLFEYDQFLLGYSALQKSNDYFLQTLPHLESAKRSGKNIKENREVLRQAAIKHIEVLSKMLLNTPPTVVWNPEKTATTTLPIKELINTTVKIRQQYE